MPARINNLPAYSVYDVSHKQTITNTTSTGSTETITGTKNNVIDKNTSTSYKITASGGGVPAEEAITIDYGSVFWNVQLFVNFQISFSISRVLEYSINGTDWTTLLSDSNLPATEAGFQLMNLRYVRFSGTNVNDTAGYVQINECRLMGS